LKRTWLGRRRSGWDCSPNQARGRMAPDGAGDLRRPEQWRENKPGSVSCMFLFCSICSWLAGGAWRIQTRSYVIASTPVWFCAKNEPGREPHRQGPVLPEHGHLLEISALRRLGPRAMLNIRRLSGRYCTAHQGVIYYRSKVGCNLALSNCSVTHEYLWLCRSGGIGRRARFRV
jgi:hypothetical protein